MLNLKALLATAAIAGSMMLSTAASALTLVGSLSSANDVDKFTVTVNNPGTTTFRAFATQSFDPILSLFRVSDGLRLAVNDDFFGLESFISAELDAGQYVIAITSFANFPTGNLGDPFSNNSYYPDGGAYTIETTNAVAGVPEPATWGLMIGGFVMVGATMRRRTTVAA